MDISDKLLRQLSVDGIHGELNKAQRAWSALRYVHVYMYIRGMASALSPSSYVKLSCFSQRVHMQEEMLVCASTDVD